MKITDRGGMGGLIIMLGCCGMKITDGGVRHNDRGANHNARLLWYAPGGLIPTIKLL